MFLLQAGMRGPRQRLQCLDSGKEPALLRGPSTTMGHALPGGGVEGVGSVQNDFRATGMGQGGLRGRGV